MPERFFCLSILICLVHLLKHVLQIGHLISVDQLTEANPLRLAGAVGIVTAGLPLAPVIFLDIEGGSESGAAGALGEGDLALRTFLAQF